MFLENISGASHQNSIVAFSQTAEEAGTENKDYQTNKTKRKVAPYSSSGTISASAKPRAPKVIWKDTRWVYAPTPDALAFSLRCCSEDFSI